MFRPITLTTALVASIALAQMAEGQPRSTTEPAKPATSASGGQDPDHACYFRGSDGRVRDLSRLCNRPQKPAITQANPPDQVKLCYGPDEEYFPCPDNR